MDGFNALINFTGVVNASTTGHEQSHRRSIIEHLLMVLGGIFFYILVVIFILSVVWCMIFWKWCGHRIPRSRRCPWCRYLYGSSNFGEYVPRDHVPQAYAQYIAEPPPSPASSGFVDSYSLRSVGDEE